MNKMLPIIAALIFRPCYLAASKSDGAESPELPAFSSPSKPWASPRGAPKVSETDVARLRELFGAKVPDQRIQEALEAASGNIWRAADVLSVWQGWNKGEK
jgi:hypothetical protein